MAPLAVVTLLHAAPSFAQEPATPSPYPIVWSVDVQAPPKYAPLVHGDRVVAALLPGLIAAYSLADGKEQWRADLAPDQPPAAYGDLVFVASGEAVYALRASDGVEQWHAPTGTVSAPLLAIDGWLIAAAGSRLSAFRAADGKLVWTHEGPAMHAAAAAAGNVLFVPASDFTIRAHDLTTGAVLWERPIGGAPAPPLVVGDSVYTGSTDKTFYCLNTANGEIRWQTRVGAVVRLRAATDGERIFFVAADNLVRALDRRHGAQRWQRGVPFRPLAGPMLAGNRVVMAGEAKEVVLLDVATGRPAGTATFPSALVVAPVVDPAASGVAIAGLTGGLDVIYKLSLAAAAKPAEDPVKKEPR